MSVTIYNEMEQVCVCCEGIVFSNRDKYYISIMDFMISNSPKKKREKVLLLELMDFSLKILFQRNFISQMLCIWLIDGIVLNPYLRKGLEY